MGNIGFVHGEGKKNLFFSFFSAFAFKQTKEHILHQVQPLKMLNNKKISFILGLQANFSIRPCAPKVIFWNWGPTTIWHNLARAQFCFQISFHPTVQVYHALQVWYLIIVADGPSCVHRPHIKTVVMPPSPKHFHDTLVLL